VRARDRGLAKWSNQAADRASLPIDRTMFFLDNGRSGGFGAELDEEPIQA